MLAINLGRRARRFVDRLPPKQAGQIDRKLENLRNDPYPPDSKSIGNIWRRADIGEYRIIYTADVNMLHVPIIGKRNDDEIYRRWQKMQ